jgi:hypothetical protein
MTSKKILCDEEIKSLLREYFINLHAENLFKENRRKIKKQLKKLIKNKK